MSHIEPPHTTLEELAAARRRIAASLSIAMMSAYFGFLLLVAFNKQLLAALLAPGLSLGILLGALLIVTAWVLTWAYVSWANRYYDGAVSRLRK